jgi:hypothetical protein
MDRGREPEAAKFYRRALTIAEQAYPPDHPTISRIRRNLDRLEPRPGVPANLVSVDVQDDLSAPTAG